MVCREKGEAEVRAVPEPTRGPASPFTNWGLAPSSPARGVWG